MRLKNLGLAVFLSITVSHYAFAGTDSAANRCSEIAALAASDGDAAGKTLAGLLSDPDEAVRACAALALRGAGEDKNAAASAALLSVVEAYSAARGNKGAFEDSLKARLKAIDSVWALGEIGDPRLMPRLAEFYAGADDVLKINLIVSMGKLKSGVKTGGPYLSAIAADTREAEVVRAAAYEMLEHIDYPAPAAALASPRHVGMEKGDLIFTGGIVGTISGWVSPDMPVGHSGIFAGTEIKDGRLRVVLADCVPNYFKPGGVRDIYAWHKFTRNYEFPFYGNRTSKVRPTAAQREFIVKKAMVMGGLGLKYKLFQKGPTEYDCVNYTEFLYESAGLNPTPDSYESGAGWPFTPWEQFEATRPGLAPLPAGSAPAGGNPANLDNIRKELGALTRDFGGQAGTLPGPQVPGEPEPAE